MHRLTIFLAGAFSVVCAMASQTAPPPVGMILQTDGTVHIKRGSTTSAARLADLLHDGDRVITASGRTLFLFCPSGERIVVGDNTTIELKGSTVMLLKGAAPVKSKTSCALPKVALGSESMERVGGMRARGYPPMSLYLGGLISSQRPVFKWEAVPKAEFYLVILKDRLGNVLWEHRTATVNYAYPESKPLLAAESYQWEVQAQSGGKPIAQQTANFEIKPNPELNEMSRLDLPLMRAFELENASYYAEAADYFRALRENNPEDTRIARRLAWLYWNAGLIAAANEELNKIKSMPAR